MSFVIALAPELEQRLNQEAARQGLPPDEYASKALDEYISLDERRRNEFVPPWIERASDPSEGYDDDFFRLLDEDRLSDRKLFPPELKGISW